MTDDGGDKGSNGTGENLLVGVNDVGSGGIGGAAGRCRGGRLGGEVRRRGRSRRRDMPHQATAAASWHGVGLKDAHLVWIASHCVCGAV